MLPAAAEMESKHMNLEMEEQLKPRFVNIKFLFLFLSNSKIILAKFSKVLYICMKHMYLLIHVINCKRPSRETKGGSNFLQSHLTRHNSIFKRENG